MEDAGVSERCRSRMCKHLVLLSLTAVTMLVSVQQVACNTSFAPGMGSLAHNKTLMDELHKKRWIQQLEDFLFLPKKEGGKEEEGKREHGRRSSPAYEKEKIDGGDDSRSAGPNGGSSVTNQLMIPNTNFPGKVNLPYFVFSKSPGKNILVFDLQRPDSTGVAKVNLWVYIWNKRNKNNRQRRKSKKGRLIKIRVFQIDERSPKGKRIAELRKHVQSSNWHRLSLPVSLVQSLPASENGTLKLRIRCKRCNHHTHLVMPSETTRCASNDVMPRGDEVDEFEEDDVDRQQKARAPTPKGRSLRQGAGRRKGRGGRHRSLEPNKKCKRQSSGDTRDKFPFMVIEDKDRTPEEGSRYRRSSSSVSSSSATSLSEMDSSPSSAAVSTSSCVDEANNNNSRSCCVLSIPVEPSEYGLGEAIVAPTTLVVTACDGACSSRSQASSSPSSTARHNRRGRRGEGSRGRRGKNRKTTTCQPTDSQPLDVWFFDHNHNLVHDSLPNMIVSQCGCRRNS